VGRLARSCGSWWPGNGTCVIAERPTTIHTEPSPTATHGELRTHNAHGPAIEYADGRGVHVWHGTYVPRWVIDNPTAERIITERNVEIRRCAIEAIGWDTFIDTAGLNLVASAPDPGNHGCELHLYDMPARLWGGMTRGPSRGQRLPRTRRSPTPLRTQRPAQHHRPNRRRRLVLRPGCRPVHPTAPPNLTKVKPMTVTMSTVTPPT
jgi:hypothetical protein